MGHFNRPPPSGLLLAVAGTCLLSSCGGEAPPRARDEIFRERMELPALYFTAQTHQRVIAPMDKGVFVHESTGELCWPALVCNNPNCPGRKADEPLLFIEPDMGVYVKADKTIGYDAARARAVAGAAGPCPACAKLRRPASETPAGRQQYIDWVQPYVLPETAAAGAKLDKELQRRIRFERSRQKAPRPDREAAPAPSGPQPTRADPATRP